MAARIFCLSCLVITLAACGTDVPEPPAPAEEPMTAVPEPAMQMPAGDFPPMVILCMSCHGGSAPSPYVDVPTIHGLPEIAIENALFDFRAKTRPCRTSECSVDGACPDTDMCRVVEGIYDAGITELAKWYAAQPYVPAGESYDPDLAARGRELHEAQCEACHTDGGMSAVNQASLLRGQRRVYLATALADYRNELRTAEDMMDTSLKVMSEEEIAALVEFYASPAE